MSDTMAARLKKYLKAKYLSRVTGKRRRHMLASPLKELDYRRNTRYLQSVSGYINGQGAGAVTDGCRYGLAPMSFSGCEIIAVYNTLVALGETPDISELIRHFQRRSAVLGGLFGTDIAALAEHFRSRGYDVSELSADRAGDYDEALREANAGIFSFWWSEESMWLHTVMLRRAYDGSDGILAYNWSRSQPGGPVLFPSIESLIRSRGVVPAQLTVIKAK